MMKIKENMLLTLFDLILGRHNSFDSEPFVYKMFSVVCS